MPKNDVLTLEALFTALHKDCTPTFLGLSCPLPESEARVSAYLPAQEALALYKANPLAGLTLVIDRLRQYLSYTGMIENTHPYDAAAFVLLLLTEQVFGPDSPESKVTGGVACNMTNQWLVKMFLSTRGMRTL